LSDAAEDVSRLHDGLLGTKGAARREIRHGARPRHVLGREVPHGPVPGIERRGGDGASPGHLDAVGARRLVVERDGEEGGVRRGVQVVVHDSQTLPAGDHSGSESAGAGDSPGAVASC